MEKGQPSTITVVSLSAYNEHLNKIIDFDKSNNLSSGIEPNTNLFLRIDDV
jgi:hypothetical protein